MRRLHHSLLLFGILLCTTASASAQNKVGLTTRTFHPKETRNWRGAQAKELHCTIWYPAAGASLETKQFIGAPDAPLFEAGSAQAHAEFTPSLSQLPLIVLSHGTGGSALQLAWLGTALARAGFIVAAVDHPGNNLTEPYTAEGFVLWWERATDLTEVIDGVLADGDIGPHVDTSRIGAAGFAIGGYTVLELAGARTDISVLYDMCRQHPDQDICHIPEMKDFGSPEQALQTVRKSSGESLARSADSFRDARIKAVFAIAPAISETLTADSLHQIRIPVALVVGAADTIAPAADNANYLRANIRGAQESTLPGPVAHYTFLDTCTAAGKSQLPTYCTESPGLDRDAVHSQVSELAIGFFTRSLRIGKGK